MRYSVLIWDNFTLGILTLITLSSSPNLAICTWRKYKMSLIDCCRFEVRGCITGPYRMGRVGENVEEAWTGVEYGVESTYISLCQSCVIYNQSQGLIQCSLKIFFIVFKEKIIIWRNYFMIAYLHDHPPNLSQLNIRITMAKNNKFKPNICSASVNMGKSKQGIHRHLKIIWGKIILLNMILLESIYQKIDGKLLYEFQLT